MRFPATSKLKGGRINFAGSGEPHHSRIWGNPCLVVGKSRYHGARRLSCVEEVFMQDRSLGNSSATPVTSQSSAATPSHHRNVWVLTAYGISGLILFGVLAYYFVQYITN